MNARTNGSRRSRTEIDHFQLVAVLLALLILLVGWATRARAQAADASIWGIVTDTSGAAVSGAKVTVTDLETGAERNTVTDTSGRYDAPALPSAFTKLPSRKTVFALKIAPASRWSSASAGK